MYTEGNLEGFHSLHNFAWRLPYSGMWRLEFW